MASSTRGGKRGKSKPKRKTLKTYKTASGAQQYGSAEDFDKLSSRLFDEAMGKSRSNAGAKEFADAVSKTYMADAGYEAARARESIDPDYYNRGEKKALESSKHFKKLAQNKAKGGAVRAYANGGAVMSGRGPKYKGMR